MAIASPTLFIRSGVSAERRKLLNGGLQEFLEGKARLAASVDKMD